MSKRQFSNRCCRIW